MLAQGWSLQGVMVTGLDTGAVTTGAAAWQRLLDGLARGPACLVEVESTQGSAPREPGGTVPKPMPIALKAAKRVTAIHAIMTRDHATRTMTGARIGLPFMF